MTSLLWLALATFVVALSLSDGAIYGETWSGYHARRIRSAYGKDLDPWLTEEQKEVLKPIMHDSAQFKEKVMEFWKELPAEEQSKWTEKYRKKCTSWIGESKSTEAEQELISLYKTDAEDAKKKYEQYLDELPEEHREKASVWKDECHRLLTGQRTRRDLDPKLADFTKWMTDEQKKEIEDMKTGGKSLSEMREKSMEFFKGLSADKQTDLKEEFKGKCKEYFTKIGTAEEMGEIKTLYEAGKKSEIAAKISAIIDRQPEDVKTTATKVQTICTEVYADKAKRRRDLTAKIEKHLSWLTEDQKQEINKMHADGKSKEEIRKTLLGWINDLNDDSKKAAKENTRKECYKWLEKAATKAEIDELHKLHETDHGACKTKVREYLKRLTPEEQKTVESNLPFCEKVWYGDHSHHGPGSHGHHHRRRRAEAIPDDVFSKYLTWLTDSQKVDLETIRATGNREAFYKKIMAFFGETTGETRTKATEELKSGCKHYAQHFFGNEKVAEIKKMKESGSSVEDVYNKLKSFADELTDEDKKTRATKLIEGCKKVFTAKASRRRRDHHHEHKLEDMFKNYLSWTTAEQQEELKKVADDKDAALKKVLEFFETTSGDKRKDAVEGLRGACKHYGMEILGEDNVATLKTLRESGASVEAMKKKTLEMVEGLTDATKKEKATKLVTACEKVYAAASRKRRDSEHKIDDVISKYLTWLSDEQKDTVRDLYKNDKKEEIYAKIMEYYEATSGDSRKTAAQELVGACKHFGRDLLGDENADKLKAMKESGVPFDEIKAKVQEMVAGITDEKKKAKAVKLTAGCEKIYTAASRKRRDQEHKIDDVISKYFSWMTQEQKDTIKNLHGEGKKEEIYSKAMEYYEATSGDAKKAAAQELMGACKHFGRHLLGDENADKIKSLKESGASVDEIKTKVEEMIAGLTDETTKTKARKLATGCAKIYPAAVGRRRRDHHHHKLDDAFTKYLTWTTQEQKDALKALEAAGDKDGIYNKIMEYFDATTGDARNTAVEELKGGCKHMGKEIFGDDKMATLKTLKESGASADELKNKALGLVEDIDDAEKKAKASKLVAGCAKVYAAGASRRRRDHHHHKLDDAFTKYLTWTTQEQKDALKALEAEDKRDEIYKKIMEYFDATTGETRTKAAAELQAGCKHIGTDIFGEAKAKEIKDLKDSGAAPEEMKKKILAMAEELTDETKKEKAKKLVAGCEKVYSVATSSRRRRDKEHKLDDAFTKWLTWTTQEQKDELKALETAGNKEEIYKKILEYFDATSGDTKQTAAEELKGACKHFGADIFGEDKVASLKTLKESGASPEDMKKKAQELVDELTDAEKKAKAQNLVSGCSKVFAVASRRRRDQNHRIDDIIAKYMSWMTQEQKDTIKDLYNNEKREEIYTKVLEYYEATSGDSRKQASNELLGACKHFGRDLLGDANADTIKALRESGASVDEIRTKAKEMVGSLTDEVKKNKALKLVAGCEKVYAGASRKRRNVLEMSFEEKAKKFLTWINADQLKELTALKEKGDHKAVFTKMMEYFEEAKSDTKVTAIKELKDACKAYAVSFFGEKHVEDFHKMKEEGASQDKMSEKVAELIDGLPSDKQERARIVVDGCKKVWKAAEARKKRRIARVRHERELLEHNGWFDLF